MMFESDHKNSPYAPDEVGVERPVEMVDEAEGGVVLCLLPHKFLDDGDVLLELSMVSGRTLGRRATHRFLGGRAVWAQSISRFEL